MAKKKDSGGEDPRKELLKELRSLIKDIPEEGLLFLIKQANTILYNMRVDELNRAKEKLNSRTPGKKQKSSESSGKLDISSPDISIERSSFGRSFVLVINGSRKIMSESEITKIVRIAYNAEDEEEGAERLFTWFKRNRDDVLLDADLKKNDPIFTALYTYIKEHFSMV